MRVRYERRQIKKEQERKTKTETRREGQEIDGDGEAELTGPDVCLLLFYILATCKVISGLVTIWYYKANQVVFALTPGGGFPTLLMLLLVLVSASTFA